jgi:hypothetical protein
MNVWQQYVEHDFVRQLGKGTLSQERFIHFLKCAAVVFPLIRRPSNIKMGDRTHREGRIIST